MADIDPRREAYDKARDAYIVAKRRFKAATDALNFKVISVEMARLRALGIEPRCKVICRHTIGHKDANPRKYATEVVRLMAIKVQKGEISYTLDSANDRAGRGTRLYLNAPEILEKAP